MTESLINNEIVQQRKTFLPELQEMHEKSQILLNELYTIKSSSLINPKPEKLDGLTQHLESLCERLRNKVRLFENGTITVAVAGVEKSGKSTMLNHLTGIELPTADERCTAVSCEILYTAPGERQYLDLIYYTSEELMAVVNDQLEYLRSAAWKEGKTPELPSLENIENFKHYSLPKLDDLEEIGRMKYGPALEGMSTIQKALITNANKLNTRSQDSIENLDRYASHKTVKNKEIASDQALIHKLVVHTHFKGGSESLRLCDTPGVDDPNPQALKRTLRGLREETDLLVLLNRPGRTPDITNDLAEFFVRLKQVDVDAPIRERTLFLVNWDKSQDLSGENARLRIEKIQAYDVFSRQNVYGPIDVIQDEELQRFMSEINNRLRSQLPVQDRALVQKLRDEWKSLQAEVRNSIYEEVKDIPVSSEKLDDDFHKWFSRANNGSHDGFIDRLRREFGILTRDVRLAPALKELNEEVRLACKEGSDQIKKYLEERVTIEACKDITDTVGDPARVFMSDLSQMMSEIVKNITGKVVKVGPLVQEKVVEVFCKAFDDGAVAENLFPGADAATRLKNLCARLRKQSRDEHVAFLIQNLEEFVVVSDQMFYITRYELRPALNMFDPLRWSQDRRQVNNDLAYNAKRILDNSGIAESDSVVKWLEDIEKSAQPAGSAHAATHAKFFNRICEISFKLILAVVRPKNNNKILALMEDFLGQASQGLSTQKSCELGWYAALKHESNLPLLFPGRAEQVRRDSERAKEYEAMIENLEKALS